MKEVLPSHPTNHFRWKGERGVKRGCRGREERALRNPGEGNKRDNDI
jgi:hypothetical protein